MAQQFNEILEQIAGGEDLTSGDARFALGQIVAGEISNEEVAAFLFGMRQKGESDAELTEFVKVMRDAAVPVDLPVKGAVDLCGTGGDRSGTFNISTAAMLVVAGAGVPVLKHGNRSVSSRSGSADVLEELGVVATLKKEGVEEVFHETGMAFMFAPNFHPAMKYVMPARKALKIRTFFNILGPLLNPANVKRQVIGVFSRDIAGKMIRILANLETERALTLHAKDGLDEVSLSSQTELFEIQPDGSITSTIFDPQSLGFELVSAEALAGGDAGENADIIQAILDGSSTDAQRDIVLLNAAFAIHVSGKADSLKEAAAMAEESLAGGSAKQKLKAFAEATQEVKG